MLIFVSAAISQCVISVAEMCILPQVLRLMYAAKKRALENAGASDLFHLRARQIHHFDLIIQLDQMIQVARSHFSSDLFDYNKRVTLWLVVCFRSDIVHC